MDLPSMSDLDRAGLTDKHRIQMANCILAWASYESHLRALLTSLEGRPLDVGARDYSRKTPEDCWKKILKILRELGASPEVTTAAQRSREASRKFYNARRYIAHAGCPGVWASDPNYILFSPFESQCDGAMALVWMPLEEISQSADFAKATTKMIQNIMETLGY